MKKPKALIFQHAGQPGCPDLLEVALFVPQGGNEQDFMLGADVRFGSMTVSSEDWAKSAEIGLTKAILSVELTGCEIEPGSHRLGDRKPAPVKTRIQRSEVSAASKQVGASAALAASSHGTPAANVKLGGGASKQAKVSATETQTVDVKEEPVVAISNSRWRFACVSERFMQSRYSGYESLCKVQVKALPVQVEGRLSFQPKDILIIDVECPSAWLDRLKKSPNQAAIAKVLLAKHLKEINRLSDKQSSAIVGSLSTLKGEKSV